MTHLLTILVGVAIAVSISHGADDSGKSAQKAADRSKDIQQSLYAVLRTMALPDASTAKGAPVTQRFVLQVPGKILNPMDYDPTNYTEDISTRRFSSFVPPVIEENMFRLTDVVPVANPMQGGETGESFMDMYEAVLNQLDVRGFDKKTSSDQLRYQKAIGYLAKPVPNPEELTENTTRLELYNRLQARYNDLRLKMEDKIKEARDKYDNDQVEYQLWFQTHYLALYANVENAYTEWLVFGEKDLVELYKAHLDVESQGVAVEDARMSLRSSGKVTLDRSSMVYPVYFEPSNWYEYLRAKPQPLSREQIQIKLGDIEARLATLASMKGTEASEDAKAFIGKLVEAQTKSKTDLEAKTAELDSNKLACMKATKDKAENKETVCQEYRATQTAITTLSTQFAGKKAKADYAKFQLRADDESKKSIEGLMTDFEIQKKRYESMLENTQEDIVDAPKTSGENDTQDLQAGWMEFEFDSSTRSKQVDKSSKSYSASLSFSASGAGWGVKGGASYSRAEQKFAQKLSQANIKISAKILKVTIKRPWFKSSIFKSDQLIMRYNQKVSPGPMPEPELIKILQSRTKTYLLPQFVNAFLLAKDVSLEFQGVDSSVQSRALQQSASAQMSGHYGPFSASASFNYGSSNSHMKAQSTADGLRIKIPGAQLIGYYVTVLSCFPKNTCPK